ncbi:hypothetical protein BJV74DRAFT_885771 [Russula compacta]|nr:hypothetical protein BJV74DRAFT_885771 [Russula compacta]
MSIRSSAQIAACVIVGLAISQAALAAPVRSSNGDLYSRDEKVAHAKRDIVLPTFPTPKPIGPVIPSKPPIGPPVFPTLKSLHFGPGPVIPTPVPDAIVAARRIGPLILSDLSISPPFDVPLFTDSGSAPTASTPVATVLPRFEGPLGPDIPHLGPGLNLPPGFSIIGQGADGSAASAASTPGATVIPRFEGQLGPDIPDSGPGFPFDGSIVPPFRDPLLSSNPPAATVVPRFEGQLGPDIPDSGPGFPFDGSIVPPFRDPFLGSNPPAATVVPRFEGQLGPDIPHLGPGFVQPDKGLEPTFTVPAVSTPAVAPTPGRRAYDDLD